MRTSRLIFTVAALAAFVGLARPTEVSAQTDLASSMTASCLNAACTQAAFILDVAGTISVTGVTFQSLASNLWKFNSLLQVFQGTTDVTTQWFPTGGGVNASQLVLNTSSFGLNDPLKFVIAMLPQTTAVTQWDLHGNISYDVTGCDVGFCFPNQYSAGGLVTVPEPTSVLLLASGLLGLAVVPRRRKGSFLTEA